MRYSIPQLHQKGEWAITTIWLVAGVLLLASLLIASVVIALTRHPGELPEGTPERTVQSYLTALQDEEYVAAYNLLSATLKEQCSLSDFVTAMTWSRQELQNSRITLEATSYAGETAIVIVRVAQFSTGEPFISYRASYEQTFSLHRESNMWRFDKSPWPYYGCARYFAPKPVPPESTATVTPTSDNEPASSDTIKSIK